MIHPPNSSIQHILRICIVLCCLFISCEGVIDPYAVLGVSKGASKDEIKKSYDELIQKWYPEKGSNTEDPHLKIEEINSAYDILTDEEKLRDYEISQATKVKLQKNQNTGNWNNLFKQALPPIISETTWLTFDNYDTFVTSDDVWVIEFYADHCTTCAEHAFEWELTAKTLKHFAKFGRITTDEEISLTRNFRIRSIPTIIALVHKQDIHQYRGTLDHIYLSEFVNSVLPHKIVSLRSQREFERFVSYDDKRKVRMLLIPTHKKEGLSSLYKYISTKYSDFLNFAQCENDAFEEILLKKYNINKRPAVIIFKETSEDPVVAYPTFNKESLENLAEENRFLTVPEITITNYNYICGRKSKYHYCGILVNKKNDEAFQSTLGNIRTLVSRLEKVEKIPRIKLGYISGEFLQFIDFFNITSDHDHGDPVLIYDIRRKRHLLYTEAVDSEHLEIFIKKLYSSKIQFEDTTGQIPMLMAYSPSNSYLDQISEVFSTPLDIIRTILSHSFSIIMIIMLLKCCRFV